MTFWFLALIPLCKFVVQIVIESVLIFGPIVVRVDISGIWQPNEVPISNS